jgi:cell division protein FtsQ
VLLMLKRKKPAGEPKRAHGRVRPDESVLDELSRAFDVESDNDNAALIDDDDDHHDDDHHDDDHDDDHHDDDHDDDHHDDDRTVSSDSARSSPVTPASEMRPALSDSPRRENSADVTTSAEVDLLDAFIELSIVTSDGPLPAPDAGAARLPLERRTIKIGDGFDRLELDSLSVDEARRGPVNLNPDPLSSSLSASTQALPAARGPAARGPAARGPAARPSGDRSTIAIGGADDLPDAVYLDGGDLGNISEGTVFIDDDGIVDAIAPKDAALPGIEPRLRQRRITVHRAMGLRRLKWVVAGVASALVALAALTVLGSGLFAIDTVSVGGNVYTDKNRLDAVIDDLRGTPVLLADTEAAERSLEAIPWVENARVRAKWPDSATIEIRERTPVATMRGADGRFRVLDDEGRVLDVIEGQPVAFILLAGPNTLNLAAGEFAPIGPASAASLVTKLTPTIRPRVQAIDVTDDGADLVIFLAPAEASLQTSPIRVRFGSAIGDSDQLEKLVRLENQLDDLPAGVVTEINVATNEVTVL